MKNKIFIGLSAISLALLTACGGSDPSGKPGQATLPPAPAPDTTSNIIFSPANAKISVPSDWLLNGTTDGTLNMPGEISAAAAGEMPDYSDPQTALGALDGWSTHDSFSISIDMATGRSVDESTMPGNVHLFHAKVGPSAGDCASTNLLHACEIIAPLTYGVDFVAKGSSNSVSIILLKPLASSANYIVALTSGLKDTGGNAIGSSADYAALAKDIATAPASDSTTLGMQSIINSYENALVAATGLGKSAFVYSMAFTTQDTVTPMLAVKGLLALNGANGMAPSIVAQNTGLTALDALGLDATNPAYAPFSAASLYGINVSNMPYYSQLPSASNPMAATSGRWHAACDSGATLMGAPAETVAALAAGPNDALCQSFGLRDLRDGEGNAVLDTLRHTTKYNPIPEPNAMLTLPGWITVPNVNVANAVRSQLGLDPISQPTNGWPVTILMHGITSKKEDMLGIVGTLSIMGQAAVFIDHPVHGERGFDLNGDGEDDVNASTISATHYMNLASLLTGRDNLRQSIADLLAVRVALHNMMDSSGGTMPIDANSVSFAGQSLGAMTGSSFAALANGPSIIPEPTASGLAAAWGVADINDIYSLESAALSVPGGGIANLLLESESFGPLIQSLLLYAASPDFRANFASVSSLQSGQPGFEEALTAQFKKFYAALTPFSKQDLENNLIAFSFATQAVVDAGDPANHAPVLAGNGTPVLLHEVVGDGAANLPDQVIPNQTSRFGVLGGTEPLIKLLGLTTATESAMDAEGLNVAVRFNQGSHGSMLDPTASAAATQEMQTQIASFLASKGKMVQVTNTTVLAE